MGILLSWAVLMGIFQFMPIDIDGAKAFAAAVQSSDNSLSSLSISPGTLSPAFQYNVVHYTASVGADVTSVEVSARLSNDTAVIESVSGNTDLKPGENLISIVVKAQDGTPATYKIVVTREGGQDAPDTAAQEPQPEETGADNPEGITVDGHSFNLGLAIPENLIPQDFTKKTVLCQGQQVEGLSFDKSELMLVYLTTPSTDVKNTLAVYDEAGDSFYPFRRIQFNETDYLIILNPPQEAGLSQEYTQTAQTVGEYQNVPAYIRGDNSKTAEGEEAGENPDSAGFCVLYGVSSFGYKGWYQYDALESTFQRYTPVKAASSPQVEPQEIIPDNSGESSVEMQSLQNAYTSMEEQYNKQRDSSRKTTAVLAFIIAVLLVVVVNLLLRGKKGGEEELPEDFDYEELTEKVREQVKSARKSRRGEDVPVTEFYGGDQGDFWEDGTVPKEILKQQTKIIPELDTEPQKAQQTPNEPGIERKPERRQEPKTEKKPERRQEPQIERMAEPENGLDEDFEIIDLEDL